MNEAIKKLFPPMRPSEDQITEYLASMFAMMVSVYTDEHGHPPPKWVAYGLLAGYLFDSATSVGWIDESHVPGDDDPNGDTADPNLGTYAVSEEYREAFFERISALVNDDILDDDEYYKQYGIRQPKESDFIEPTPKQLLELFFSKTKKREGVEWMAELMVSKGDERYFFEDAGTDEDDRSQAEQRKRARFLKDKHAAKMFILRLMEVPDELKDQTVHRPGKIKLAAICEIMKSKGLDEFRKLTPDDLTWRLKRK
jgi:hypothetical protein